MKKLIYTACIAVFALGTFISCDVDEEITEEIVEEVTEDTLVAAPSNLRTSNFNSGLQTINDLRAAGIPVSRALENAVNNDLQTLLDAAELSTTRRGRRILRRRGFRTRLIRELRRIASQLETLVIEDPEPDPEPDTNPVDPGTILQIADLNLSADAQLALSFGSAEVGSVSESIDRTVVIVSTNSLGLFSLANDGRIIDQNGQLRTRNQFEQDILDDFRRRFGSTAQNSVNDFDAVIEEFRPLAANGTDNLLFLLNN